MERGQDRYKTIIGEDFNFSLRIVEEGRESVRRKGEGNRRIRR